MTTGENPKRKRVKLEVIDLDKPKSYNESWKYARELEDREVISNISIEEVHKKALEFDDYRDRALFIILYMTAARIEEIVRYQKIKWGKKQVILIREGYKPQKKWVQDWRKKRKIGEPQQSIMKKDITIRKVKGIPCLRFHIRNLKNRKDKTKVTYFRLDREINKKLYRLLEPYLKSIPYDFSELFPFGIRQGERILNKIKWNPHSLRAIRLTHLVRYEKYSDQILKSYAGWSDSRPSKRYIRLQPEDQIF